MDLAARIRTVLIMILLLLPVAARSQSYSGVATSISGRPLPSATVTVCSGQSDVLVQNPQQSCNGQAALNPPSAPTLTAVTDAAPVAGTYKVVSTYLNSVGETIGSVSSSITTSGGSLGIQVTSPAAYSNATRWNAYLTVAGGTIFYLQNSSPIAIGTNYTQNVAVNTAAVNPPVSTTATAAILPLATIYSNVEQTVTLANPFNADGNGRYTLFAPAGSYTASISSPGYVMYSAPFIVPASLSGNIAFTGPSPWYDVSANGVDCTGATDSTVNMQAVITAAASHVGSKIFFPPSCNIQVSALTINSVVGPLVVTGGSGTFSPTPTIKFTGTCAASACLQINSSADIEFSLIVFTYPNCTTAPCEIHSGSNRILFHHVGRAGPSTSIGPLVEDTGNAFGIVYDSMGWCETFSVCISGPLTGSSAADTEAIRDQEFTNYSVAGIQNPAQRWTIDGNLFIPGQSGSCVGMISNAGGYVLMQNLQISNNTFEPGPNSCSNSYTDITLSSASGNAGGATITNNLVLPNAGSTTGTFLSVGNGQNVVSYQNTLQNTATAYALGTSDVTPFIADKFSSVTTTLTGTPQAGQIYDPNTGNTNIYTNATRIVVISSTGQQVTTENAATYQTTTRCNPGSSASPAACGSAASGTVVVPTTTTTYTVDTTAVTANSDITITPITDASGLTGSPTCNAPPTPFIGYVSGRSAGVSFTFTLPSTTGASCWTFWIRN